MVWLWDEFVLHCSWCLYNFFCYCSINLVSVAGNASV